MAQLQIVEGRDRCHPFIGDIITHYAIMYAALRMSLGLALEENPVVRKTCTQAQVDLAIAFGPHLGVALSGAHPSLIDITVEPKQPQPEGIRARGLKTITTNLISSFFSVFAEQACDWIKLNHSTDYYKWPPVANFCRVVRNAIVHGGTINTKSEAAPVVRWRNLEFSHRDYGRVVLNTGDMSTGDLIILMMELDAELNGLGAPFDLG